MSDPYDSVYEDAGRAWGVDPNMLRAIKGQESGHTTNPDQALSPAGAQGRMQLMPGTAKDLGVTNPNDPVQSIFGGAKYFSQMLDKYNDPHLALAAYNAGPGRVDAYLAGRGQLPAETVAYVPAVAKRFQNAASARAPAPAPTAAPAPGSAESYNVDNYSAPPPKGAPTSAPAPTPNGLSDDELMSAFTGGAKPSAVAAPAPSTLSVPIGPSDAALMASVTSLPNPQPSPAPNNGASQTLGALNVARAAGEGAAEGWGPGKLGFADSAENALRQAGVFPNPASGQGGIMRGMNEALLGPVVRVGAAAADTATRLASAGLGAYQHGIMQAGQEVGQPLLGRDLAAGPEAFPFGFGEIAAAAPAMAANKLAVAGRDAAPAATMDRAALAGRAGVPTEPMALPAQPMTQSVAGLVGDVPVSNQLTGTIGRAANDTPNVVQFPGNKLAGSGGITAEPLPAPSAAPGTASTIAPSGASPMPGMGPAPQSMGAAATPDELAQMTPKQQAAYRTTAEMEKLNEPQPIGRDLNAYVHGVDPTLAQTELNVKTSRELKALNIASPEVSEQSKEVASTHNEARGTAFSKLAGSAVNVENATSTLDDKAGAILGALWQNKGDADPSSIMSAGQAILDSPDGRRPVVRAAINSVIKEMTGPDGKLLTDPEMIYGVRKHIDDLMSKENGATDPLSQRAKSALLKMKEAVTGTIEESTPGFDQYLSNFANDSKPIDEMRVLQSHQAGLYNAQNQMQYSRFQKMMGDIVESRAASGINDYKSISDETMGKLWGLRDDLRRAATEKELASTPGSDSVQNYMDLARLGGTGLLHAGLLHTLGPMGNMALGAVKGAVAPITAARTARKQTARGLDILRPDRTAAPLRNALTGDVTPEP